MLGTSIVLELQYYMEHIVRKSSLNKLNIPVPATVDPSFIEGNQSFIRLLFDDNWPSSLTHYRYLYREETNKRLWPSFVLTRMMVYGKSSKYYVCDSDDVSICNINLFNLKEDDLNLIDKLLLFRTDSTCDISYINIDDLKTNLSKLIYIYLNFKLTNDYELYNNTDLISNPSDLLLSCYEVYVIETMFSQISTLYKM